MGPWCRHSFLPSDFPNQITSNHLIPLGAVGWIERSGNNNPFVLGISPLTLGPRFLLKGVASPSSLWGCPNTRVEAVFSLQTFVLPKRNADNSKDNHGLMTGGSRYSSFICANFRTTIRHANILMSFRLKWKNLWSLILKLNSYTQMANRT